MKKKIIIGLSIFSLIFFVGGIYIITTIESATSKLDKLIMLHQVGILREHLSMQIKKVQSDIHLKNTRYASAVRTVVSNVIKMELMMNTCFDCHHSRDIHIRLNEMRKDIEEYKKAISRLFTLSANVRRLKVEEDKAFSIGDHLVTNLDGMLSMASIKLEEKTQASLKEITETKILLYILVAIVPFLAGSLGFIFIRGFTKPVNALLGATRKLKSGDLDFRIEGLKSEFGELATSINEMSGSLKEHMHKIQENEKRYRKLFESSGDAIFMLDAEGENTGRIVSANKAAAEMHGYTVDELMGLNLIKDLDTPDAAVGAPERIRRMFNGEWISAEINHCRKDGTIFPVEISAGLFEFMDHKYILAFDRDITGRKKSEEALMRSYIMFTTVLDSIDSIIYVADLETYEVLYLNKYARNIFGDIEGKICWQTLHAGQSGPCDFCSNDKLLTPEGNPAGVFHWEFQNAVNGTWYDIYDRAIQWIDGRIVKFEIATDITERKKIEESLKRAEQMKLVGEWAAGLAHEIKNSLAGIKISVEVLADGPNISEEDKASIFLAIDEIKRIELLLKKMLNFARPPQLQLFAANVNEILDNAIGFSLMQSIASYKIKIIKEYDGSLPETMADRLQLRQVFMNILINADEAIQNGGTLVVKTSYNPETDVIHVKISDNGEGIDEKVINRIFEPFFTTKSKGTGLGLAITKRIVEQHGGAISVKSKLAGGSAFSISIPVKPVEKE